MRLLGGNLAGAVVVGLTAWIGAWAHHGAAHNDAWRAIVDGPISPYRVACPVPLNGPIFSPGIIIY